MHDNLNEYQPPPVTNTRRPVWELVIEDVQQRNATGVAKYGTPLQAFNGRDPLIDAYQEALDLAVYLRQAIEERSYVERNHRSRQHLTEWIAADDDLSDVPQADPG